MKDKSYIHQQTINLINYCKQADQIYEGVRTEGKEKDFHTEVKPFADKVHKEAAQWGKDMKEWLNEEKFPHLFPQMIDQTVGNLSDVAVQAFFPKTSYKRFKSHVQSVSFILQSAEIEIGKKLRSAQQGS
ncbi:YppE family protein [Peribacillus sp. SCS-155]|uniref:YppE family protein n=1 Tax=Peribacillus sedimenti TaxID=3115297 RepID=UPI003906C441